MADTNVQTLKTRGVCGNFRFKFYDVTNVATTNSVFPADMSIMFVAGTNTSVNTDSFGTKKLSWTGDCDANTPNELEDSSETFVQQINALVVYNNETGDTDLGAGAVVGYQVGDTDNLLLYALTDGSTPVDIFKTGDEAYRLEDEHFVEVTSANNTDDGTVIVFGR